MAGGNRGRRGPAPRGGHRRRGLAAGALGSDQGGPARLHRLRPVLPGRADRLRRSLVLRHPQRRVSRRGRARADRDGVRRRRGHEQLPAREHRHVRHAADVRRDHPVLYVRRLAGRLPRPEDLLHDRRDVRLPLSLPLGARLVQREPGQLLRPPGGLDRDRRGRGIPARAARPHLLAAAEEALGAGEAGRRDPLAAAEVLHARLPARARVVALQAGGDRDLPGGLRHPRHLRVDHVGHGLRLSRECRVGDAGGGRHHPGHERARAGQVLRRRAGRGRQLLDGPAADHDRLERPLRRRPRPLGLRLDRWEEARRPVLHRRQGEGRGAEGAARREEAGEAGCARGRGGNQHFRPDQATAPRRVERVGTRR